MSPIPHQLRGHCLIRQWTRPTASGCPARPAADRQSRHGHQALKAHLPAQPGNQRLHSGATDIDNPADEQSNHCKRGPAAQPLPRRSRWVERLESHERTGDRQNTQRAKLPLEGGSAKGGTNVRPHRAQREESGEFNDSKSKQPDRVPKRLLPLDRAQFSDQRIDQRFIRHRPASEPWPPDAPVLGGYSP